jgi:CRISPR-associated exonuclease Cas4
MEDKIYSEDQLIPISGIAHFCYCERRYALIHLEQIWLENRFTVEGEILHERVHAEHHESRKYFRQEYSMAVRSLAWGLIGKCDLVELWLNKDGSLKKVSPVEFKRGRKKESLVDRVQLCAQALCLEEMLGVTIENGQFYYLQEHRRSDVMLDQALREITLDLLKKTRALQDSGKTPQAEYEKRKCANCSLVDSCMPRSTNAGAKQVERFIQNNLHLIKEL